MTFAQFKKTIPRIKKKMQGWPYKAQMEAWFLHRLKI